MASKVKASSIPEQRTLSQKRQRGVGHVTFELERHLREDNESEGKVGTSSFLLFQSRLYSVVGANETNTDN